MLVLVINMKGFYIGLGFLSCMLRCLFLFCNCYVILIGWVCGGEREGGGK